MLTKQQKINSYGDVKFQVKNLLKSLPDEIKNGLEDQLNSILTYVDKSVEELKGVKSDTVNSDVVFPSLDTIVDVLTESSGYSGWEAQEFVAEYEDVYQLTEAIESKVGLRLDRNIKAKVIELQRNSKSKNELIFVRIIVGAGYVTGFESSENATLEFPFSTYQNFLDNLKTIE